MYITNGHISLLRIDTQHDLSGKPAANALKPDGVFERLRAYHNAIHAIAEYFHKVRFRAKSTAELAGNACRFDNAADAVPFHGPASFGAGQGYDAQVRCPLANPPPCHGCR